jgi:hypothetical protein
VNHHKPENLKRHYKLYYGNKMEQEAWKTNVKELIKEGKKINISTDSKEAVQKFESFIKKETKGKYRFYNKDKSDKQKEDFDDLNTKWEPLQVVAWSPQVSHGCSYTKHDFDTLCGYRTPLSSIPRQSQQREARIRQFLNKEAHVFIRKYSRETAFYGIQDMMEKVIEDGPFFRSLMTDGSDKEIWTKDFVWLYQDVYAYNRLEEEWSKAYFLRETLKIFMRMGCSWDFVEIKHLSKEAKKQIKSEDPSRQEQLRVLWDQADIYSEETLKQQIVQVTKPEQQKTSVEKSILFYEFPPEEGYSDEDRFQLFCKREDVVMKRQLNRIKWLKQKKSFEEVRRKTEGKSEFQPGLQFHNSEALIYQQYIEIHETLEIPPLGETEIHSKCLLDLKKRKKIDQQIKNLIQLARMRDRSKPKTKGKVRKLPNIRKLFESLDYCSHEYDGSKWRRYCVRCKSCSCVHAKKQKWETPTDANKEKQNVWNYKRIPSKCFYLIK